MKILVVNSRDENSLNMNGNIWNLENYAGICVALFSFGWWKVFKLAGKLNLRYVKVTTKTIFKNMNDK